MSNVLNKLQIKIRIKVLGFPLHVCSFQEAIISFPMCAGVLNLSPTTLFSDYFDRGDQHVQTFFRQLIPSLHKFPFCFSNAISGHILVLSIQHGNVFRILECNRNIVLEFYMEERSDNHQCSSISQDGCSDRFRISQWHQHSIWQFFPRKLHKNEGK